MVWGVRKSKGGETLFVKPILANVTNIIHSHPEWKGVLAFDTFRQQVVKLKPAPARFFEAPLEDGSTWGEADDSRTSIWLQALRDGLSVDVGSRLVREAVETVARATPIHPVRDWLTQLEWDGVKRLEEMGSDFIYSEEPQEYVAEAVTKWMISAIARVYTPGCKADSLLVLEGPQGIGKSTFGRVLASAEWYCDSHFDAGEKDAYQLLNSGFWIIEIAELTTKSQDVDKVKAFVSSATDVYRKAYGRDTVPMPRQCIFIGTTNERAYLRDSTGNRRFWPVRIRGINRTRLIQEREQLWAEALELWKGGTPWHIEDARLVEVFASRVRMREVEDDAWIDPIRNWLDERTKVNPKTPEDGVTTSQVLGECLSVPPDRRTNYDSQRVGKILRQLGFTDIRRVSKGQYGGYRAYCVPTEVDDILP